MIMLRRDSDLGVIVGEDSTAFLYCWRTVTRDVIRALYSGCKITSKVKALG